MRLRQAREIARLSAYALSKHLGISRQALSQMELDQIDIPPAKIEQIAQLLATTPSWLRFAAGPAPLWSEVPLMVAEMDLVDHTNLNMRLRRGDPDDEIEWRYYRTRREWAVPASEVQRLGAEPDKLIAVRVGEPLPPEFKRGDIVILDRAANRFGTDGYYGAIFEKKYMLARLSRGEDGSSLLVNCRQGENQNISARAIHIIGPVVFSIRRRTNFSL
jgi:transcriptional regulator with XRE-family HTH domain